MFCVESYRGRNSEEIIDELKSIKETHRNEALCDVLQNFVNWLMTVGLSNTTVNQYAQIVTFYLGYHGIKVHESEIRYNVRKPKKIKEKLHALTREEILRIFEHSPDFRKMLYLTLIGSGMRIQECVALRRKDFDVNFPKRIKIEIPAQYTKSLTSHTTFVNKQASKFLKPHLESLGNDEWFFQTVAEPDKITLEPGETVEYKIITVPLKAGTYHVHTQVTSDNGSKLGPGQTIVVNGSSDITMGEMLGIYARFAVLVLFAIAGILMARKIISKRRDLRLENEK